MCASEIELKRLKRGDAGRLRDFYEGLSPDSKRLFRPLGLHPDAAVFERIVAENAHDVGKRYDLVAVAGDQIVGWSFLTRLDSPRPGFGLAVADGCRGRGLGSRLTDEVLQFARIHGAKEIYLSVVADNEIAREMYRHRGFKTYEKKVHEEDGLLYLHMVKELERGEFIRQKKGGDSS